MIRTVIACITCTFMLVPRPCRADDIVTPSPDGRIAMVVSPDGDGVAYSITVDGRRVIAPTPISITIDGATYPSGKGMNASGPLLIDREIVPTVPVVASRLREFCNETEIRFDGPVGLRVRAYNDGVAFRWESRLDAAEVTVNGEQLAFRFADDVGVYFPVPNGSGYFSHQENEFHRQPVSDAINEPKPGCAPFLFDLGTDRYMLVTDVNVMAYPGLWIHGGKRTTLQAHFPPYPVRTELEGDRNLKVAEAGDFLARCAGARSYPWRAFVIGPPANLLTSTLLYTLAEPCRLDDTSWIRPGKVSWDWWNHWNITDVPIEPEPGVNQDTYKAYIDFASANGLPYIILDEGWSVRGADHLLDVVPALDIPSLVRYGAERKVEVILWMTSAALERSFDRAFDQFDAWGVKGLKVDFMQRDDQVMMDFLVRVAEEAARHKLLVDYHGGTKPVGWQRTYPNVITQESVLGLEQSKWSKHANPEMATLLPFTRLMTGPMDYTPGAMDNFIDSAFQPNHENPGSLGTRCQQLAMYVVFVSPLQMLADTPTKYRRNPECLEFLRAVPTTWDETVVLQAAVGDVVAVARRHGDTWFIGALTDWTPRELNLHLHFLGSRDYDLVAWTDGPRAAEIATEFVVDRATVSGETILPIRLAPGGGYAAMLTPRAP